MKDIIAVLEAKRAAARAGGKETRCLAQLPRLLIASAVIYFSVASASHADPISQTFDEGRFTLTAPVSWTLAGEYDVSHGSALWAIRPTRQPTADSFVQCSLRVMPGTERRSQAEVNARVAGWTFERFRDATASRQRLISFSNEQVGGIQVVTIEHDRNYTSEGEFTTSSTDKVIRSFERHWGLARHGQEQVFTLWCGAPMPMVEQDTIDVGAVLSSLTFAH
jgi:hypothetical protein